MISGSLLYQDLTRQEKETVLGYFLLRLLKKEELWDAEPKEVFVYLAYLLLSLIGSAYQAQSQKYRVRYETELAQVLEKTSDLAQRYCYLKFNADDLLVTCGIFRPAPSADFHANVERGKIYYKLTASCAHQIQRKPTPLVGVFEHLAACFEEYQRRLNRLRRAYLYFVNRLTEEEIRYLQAQLDRLTF